MPTILVADDNSNIQKMVSLVFAEKGIGVVAVGNGEAACRKMSEVHPDLVLADVFMPVRSGYEVCEFVKHDPQFAAIPVILLVGAFDPLDEKEAQRVGADGVLKKPFVPPDPLITMVTSLLHKNVPPAPQAAPPQEIAAAPKQEPPPARRTPITYVHAEPEPVPEEFAFGTAPRDFDETDDASPALGQPVATPSAKYADEDHEDEEPASEWKQRRNTMEYDISAAESSSMVERLAGQDMAPEVPPLDAAEAAPPPAAFGDTNIPEKIESRPAPARVDWMDLMTALDTKEAEPIVHHQEVPTPVEERKAPSRGSVYGLPWERPSAGTEAEDSRKDAAHDEPQIHGEPSTDGESGRETASAYQTSWPAPPTEAVFSRPPVNSELVVEESHMEAAALEPPVAASEKAYLETMPEAGIEPQETSAVETHEEFTHSASFESPAHEEKISHKEIPNEAAEAAAAKSAKIDSAAIDSVVAKLLEKLEPQIHEALSNGVLRPLVEEMLNRERNENK
ncbi:MAG TPA: response regulator [Candidatus Limnocylindrales bacterium]|nr:response regulator [Candidatus Limnocylindrales bacterium]